MMMLLVVPRKKLSTESSGILVGAKPLGKLWAVLHRLELALRIGIIVGYMRTTVGLGHSQLRQQEGHRLGGHRRSPVGMKRETSGLDLLTLQGLLNKPLGQLCRFSIRHHPAHHVTAENVQDHVEVKVSPLRRPQ